MIVALFDTPSLSKPKSYSSSKLKHFGKPEIKGWGIAEKTFFFECLGGTHYEFYLDTATAVVADRPNTSEPNRVSNFRREEFAFKAKTNMCTYINVLC